MTDEQRTERTERTSGIEDLGPVPKWTQRESDDFVHARDLIGALVAEFSARVHAATDPDAAESLRARQRAYFAEMRGLTPRDHDAIRRVLAEYPELLRKTREGDES